MLTRNVYSGSPWEAKVAYCRAKRVGDSVFVSGTVAVDPDGKPVAPGAPYEQARYALQKIERALLELGASLRDVVRTRTFLVNIDDFEHFARAHHEAFEGVDPVATCVQVARLVAPEYVVEIEVDALVGAGASALSPA
jgi:enamine deaminase RidA (YjgF/YER057c/UK114 family)